jgi:hypothetical protein
MLGLSVDNAARLVRKWEEEEPSGPAAIALRYLSQGLPGYRGELREWSYQHEFHASAARGLQVLHRQWWPRFVARVEGGIGRAELKDVQWIDEPGGRAGDTIKVACEAFRLVALPDETHSPNQLRVQKPR